MYSTSTMHNEAIVQQSYRIRNRQMISSHLETWHVVPMLPQKSLPVPEADVVQRRPINVDNPLQQFLIEVIVPLQ